MPGLKDIISNIVGSSTTSFLSGLADIADKFITTPDEKKAFMQAAQAEVDRHNEALIDKANEAEKNQLQDIADARQTNVSIQQSEKASWMAKNVGYVIDIFVTSIWGFLTIYIIARVLKLVDGTPNAPDLTAVFGVFSGVTAAFMTVLNFHRSSTASSKTKDETIKQLSSQP